jgi:hypothetical protein
MGPAPDAVSHPATPPAETALAAPPGRLGRVRHMLPLERNTLAVVGAMFLAHIERGELVPVLEAYSTPFPGFYLYYPQRRQASPPLRALLDYLRRLRPS